MQINNPLQMNDWEIKSFLKVVLAVQCAMWSVIGLDAIGLQIPVLRQFIGFIYLTFIPGLLILRILKLHKLGNVETVVYAVGLSIATLMFTGLVMNFVYPFLGVSGPITITPLIITISAVVLMMCALCYVRDSDFCDPYFVDIKDVLSPPALFLCIIPFLCIIGTYLVNFHQNNIVLMFLIIIIALIVLLIGFDKFIHKNLYPLAIFIIAISLLYHNSLISMYIWGWDIHHEYYFSNLVLRNSYWASTIPATTNAMLSIVMLAPIFSKICGMNLSWVFKIFYPFLFSLVPVGMYRVFQKQTDDKIAFLACFFFVSIFTFYGEMLSLARQQIAELFLVLLILLMIDKNMNKIRRVFLLIVFSISLAVSHYGLSYIYMFSLISVWIILIFIEKTTVKKIGNIFHSEFSKYKYEKIAAVRKPYSLNSEDKTIRSSFVLLFIVFALAWYMYVSRSSVFTVFIQISDHIASNIFTDFLNPNVVQGLDIILKETSSPLHDVLKYLHLITQFFIAIGILTWILNPKVMKFEREYEAFLLVYFVICLTSIAVPYFASSLNTSRIYHIALIFLAPFCVIGGITVFRGFCKIVKKSWKDKPVKSFVKVLSVFFVIFFLFNSSWIYEVVKDHPRSISLSQETIIEYSDINDIKYFYTDLAYIPEQNILGVNWILKNRNDKIKVYSDYLHKTHIFRSYGMLYAHEITNTTKIEECSYIYLGYLNVHFDLMYSSPCEQRYWKVTDISSLDTLSKIYSNKDSVIYYYDGFT